MDLNLNGEILLDFFASNFLSITNLNIQSSFEQKQVFWQSQAFVCASHERYLGLRSKSLYEIEV